MATVTETVPTTKLEAVNALLRSIGERPVNDISDPKRLDVAEAIRLINQEAKRLLSRGWWFNTEEAVTIAPNASGELIIPDNALKIVLSQNTVNSTSLKLVERGRKLYDLTNRVDSGFTDSVDVDVVMGIDYEEMPESARQVVFYRAAVSFQSSALGSQILFQFTQRDAEISMAVFLEDAIEFEGHNLITSNWHNFSNVLAHRRW